MPEETPIATLDQPADDSGGKPPRLEQSVTLADVGPCRKHVRVVIDRKDIDLKLRDKFNEMMPEAQVPGYRPGKAPRKLIEKKFFKEVSEQIKGELLLQSLEQLAEDYKLNPIAQPNIDPFRIELPEEGPFTYEFEIEVAPEFELPDYKGLRLKRPVKDITPAEMETAKLKFLRRFGQLSRKEGGVELEDRVVADVLITLDDKKLNEFKDLALQVDPQLAFTDGVIPDFGAKLRGAKAGETRQLALKLSPALADPHLRGKTALAAVTIKQVQQLKLPELSPEFLQILGCDNEEALNNLIRSALERQLEYEQRQAAREQVLQKIAAAATWDLPSDLLHRQAQRNLSRRILEMRNAGFSEDEIRARANLLRQDILDSTARGLKEHFVLQKIAEVEKIEVGDEDVNEEIESIARQADESPRKVRARLEREDMMETLMMEVLERKALDLVLASATYEDVPFVSQGPATAAVEGTASGIEPEPAPPLATPNEPAAAGALPGR